jgi:hypothetical protein
MTDARRLARWLLSTFLLGAFLLGAFLLGAAPAAASEAEPAPAAEPAPRPRFHLRLGAGPQLAKTHTTSGMRLTSGNAARVARYGLRTDGLGATISAGAGIRLGRVVLGVEVEADYAALEPLPTSATAVGLSDASQGHIERTTVGIFTEGRFRTLPLFAGANLGWMSLLAACCREPEGFSASAKVASPGGLALSLWLGTEYVLSERFALRVALRGSGMRSNYSPLTNSTPRTTSLSSALVFGVALN